MSIWENLELLKRTRARTLSMVDGVNQQQSEWRPLPGKWSIGEQLDHLLLAEAIYRDSMRELIDLAKAGRPAVIRRTMKDLNFRPNVIPEAALPLLDIPFTLANLFIPRGVRELLITNTILPSQRPDAAQPAQGRPKAELTSALESSVRETALLIETHREMDFTQMTFEHPVLGSHEMPFLVRLTALHEYRHQKQIDAILRAMPAATSLAHSGR